MWETITAGIGAFTGVLDDLIYSPEEQNAYELGKGQLELGNRQIDLEHERLRTTEQLAKYGLAGQKQGQLTVLIVAGAAVLGGVAIAAIVS
ncbi:MAG: hypothetical protein KC422_23085 [Trueperaceae bacterium]|nr:hypothetical protein [Trueperaceae bacterium]